ncbi:MAG: hypothetical protein H3Z51_10070 [archaeon]|nr:hypothetical protein [archaeon]
MLSSRRNSILVIMALALLTNIIWQPAPLCYGAAFYETRYFSGSRTLFQSPILDLLGYKIYISGELDYHQYIGFSYDVSRSVLNYGDSVTCSTSISPQEPQLAILIVFHFGGNSYTFEYEIPYAEVPGESGVASIPIPVGSLLLELGLPPLPINLYLNMQIQSRLTSSIPTLGFTASETSFSWVSTGTKTAICTLVGTDQGVASISLSNLVVQHTITASISIGVPLIGTYTLYTFPITDAYFYGQDLDLATYYRLIVSSEYGVTTGSAWYQAGSQASFDVTPNIVAEGAKTRHVFISWSGSGPGSYTGSLRAATVTMNAPITQTANWEKQYQLTIEATEGGITSPAPGLYWESIGTSMPITATPSSGYVFKEWLLDGSVVSSEELYTVVMDSPHSMTARFEPRLMTPSTSIDHALRETPIVGDIIKSLDAIVPGYGSLLFISIIIAFSAIVGYLIVRFKKKTKKPIVRTS